jgi:hypothetical protein
MSSYFTTNSLIADIKRRGMIPTNQKTFLTADFLALANDELLIGIIPTILQLKEEYYVYSEEVSLTASQSAYQIPYRAMGGKLRDVFYKDTGGTIHEMTRVSADDKGYYQSSYLENRFVAYYVQGDEIVITPDVGANATGSLVFTYFLRPNELVEETRISTITAVSTGASTTTYSCSVPSAVVSAFAADSTLKFDILQKKAGHRIRKFDITPTVVATTGFTFTTSDLPTGANAPVVGDYIAYAGECIIPQIPDELHSVLSQRVAARCVEAMGDQNSLQLANAKLAEMESKTSILVDSRVDGSPQKVTNKGGLLQRSRVRRRGWF